MSQFRVIVSGGGTGGHIFPAIAIANAIKEKCPDVKFIAHYAILGQYDFIDIYEAPNVETAAKVSMISQANGALHAESLAAIQYKRFLELTKEI